MPTKYTLEQLFVIVDKTNTYIMYSEDVFTSVEAAEAAINEMDSFPKQYATVITLDEHMFSLMAQCTIDGREMVMNELELH
jgi:hypothetical protein